jgi:hypothetical protein
MPDANPSGPAPIEWPSGTVTGASGAIEPAWERSDARTGSVPPTLPIPGGTTGTRGAWPAGLVAGVLLLGLIGMGVLYALPPDQYGFYPRCGLYTLTGLQCPACGSLRAVHHLAHARIGLAFHHNPVLVGLLPLVFGYAAWRWLQRRPFLPEQPGFRRIVFWVAMAGLALFTVVRNLPPSILTPWAE